MRLWVEGNEIKVKGDIRIHEDAHKHPGKYATEDDRTPWEYSAGVAYRSLSSVAFRSTFYSEFVYRILLCLDSGRTKGEGPVSLETRGEFVHLIREKVTKEITDLYNQAYYEVEGHYVIERRPRIEPKPGNTLIVTIGVHGSDPRTFVGEILHKNGERPHLLPPNRFPHLIDDTIEYLSQFHAKGEGQVFFHNKLAGDPKNEQRGILLGRVIDLFNKARYLQNP